MELLFKLRTHHSMNACVVGDALLRETGEDVTSQVVKAYKQTIGTRIKDYLPKREELIAAAFQLFLQGVKMLGGS